MRQLYPEIPLSTRPFLLLQEISGDAFMHLKILVELNLSRNNITHIEKGTFRGNERLQTLNLAGNQVGSRTCAFIVYWVRLSLSKYRVNHQVGYYILLTLNS